MKILGTLHTYRNCAVVSLPVLFFITGLINSNAHAQDFIPKLSEDDIRVAIPLIEEETQGYGELTEAMETERDVLHALFNDIQSGKIDPLKWLRQRSKHIIAPPGAVYEPECSRAVSVRGWDSPGMQDPELNIKPTARPTVIFSFGKDISAVNKHLLGNKITTESYSRFRENPFNADDPSYKKIRTILEEARTFYMKNGFSANYSMDGYTVTFYPRDSEGELAGIVWQVNVELFDPSYPDVARRCGTHSMGPSIEIRAGDALMERFSQGGRRATGDIGTNFIKSLRKAGMTEDRYALIKTALVMARNDSENPEEPETPGEEFTPSTPEEKETAELLAMMKENAKIRRHNMILYKKNRTDLDPLLDILQKYMGGQ